MQIRTWILWVYLTLNVVIAGIAIHFCYSDAVGLLTIGNGIGWIGLNLRIIWTWCRRKESDTISGSMV